MTALTDASPLAGRRVLLIVGGGIAAVKAPDLIRRLRERGAAVRCVLTAAGHEFTTPLALSSLSEDRVFQFGDSAGGSGYRFRLEALSDRSVDDPFDEPGVAQLLVGGAPLAE